MNIIAATRGADGAAIELPFGEIRADPAESAWAQGAAAAAPGTPFLFGIRPFDVRVSQSGAGYHGEVRLVEPLGDLTIVDCMPAAPTSSLCCRKRRRLASATGIGLTSPSTRPGRIFSDPATERRSHEAVRPRTRATLENLGRTWE